MCEWVSSDPFMDMQTLTAYSATSNAYNKGRVSFVCLKKSQQMKQEKIIQLTVFFYCVAKVVYFRCIDINITKQ